MVLPGWRLGLYYTAPRQGSCHGTSWPRGVKFQGSWLSRRCGRRTVRANAMSGTWRERAVRLGANLLLGLGLGACGLGIWLGSLGLVEGVTLLAGEGTRLRPESPEQIRQRLTIIGCLLAGAAVGWLLARLGESFRQARRPSCRCRLLALAGDQLLFLGGACIGLSCLIAGASFQADLPVPKVYYLIAVGAAVAAPALLSAGVALRRRVPPGDGHHV